MSRTPLYFGGSFNPLHVGHLICARAAAEQLSCDKIVLVPSAQPPHKNGDTSIIPADHRLAICRAAAAEDHLFEVDDLELKRPGPSYTIDTARELRQNTGQKVRWVIGADMLAILPQWYESAKLIKEIDFILIARPGWTFDWKSLPESYQALRQNVVSAPLLEISATDIRRRVAAGLPITYLVPPSVERYIQEHGLYRDPTTR